MPINHILEGRTQASAFIFKLSGGLHGTLVWETLI
jgi:hypothetical protein